MNPARIILLVVGIAVCIATAVSQPFSTNNSVETNVRAALQKDVITLLITDSGLGGLSVCAAIETQVQQHPSYKKINLIFCNALPETNIGYNNLESEERKAEVFSEALSGMAKWYHPDVILIACNTLSVVYPNTQFSKTSSVPVLGIVELGAEMIYEKMKADTGSSVILFGTETTISANSHKTLLVSMGIPQERIVGEACMELAGEIQSNPMSDMVTTMVGMYVDDAVSQLSESRKGKVYAGLCCTHYGYSAATFTAAFKTAGIESVEIVNPNDAMVKTLMNNLQVKQVQEMNVTVSVVSRAPLSKEEIGSIGSLIEKESPKTSGALKTYELKRDLFTFENK